MKRLVFTLFFASCAHYSVATGSTTIAVPPFTIEASTDLNGAQLATTLVSRLQHFGLNAKFGTSPSTQKSETLTCHVLSDQIISGSKTGNVGFSRVKVVCQNGSQTFTQLLTGGANMTDTLDNRKVLIQSAANEAVENISVEISKHLISLERER